jgi:hypothetical protein
MSFPSTTYVIQKYETTAGTVVSCSIANALLLTIWCSVVHLLVFLSMNLLLFHTQLLTIQCSVVHIHFFLFQSTCCCCFILCCLPSGTLLFILLLLFHNIQCALLPTTHMWIPISGAIFLALQVVSCSGAYFLVLGALLVFYLLVFLSINLLLLLLFHDVHTLQLKVINSNYSAFLTVFVIVLLYQEREREREREREGGGLDNKSIITNYKQQQQHQQLLLLLLLIHDHYVVLQHTT